MLKAIFGLLGIVFVGYIVFRIDPAYGWLMVIVAVASILIIVLNNRGAARKGNQDLWAGLTAQAFALENIAKAGFSTTAEFALDAGEKLIAQVPNIELAEYKSGGSTYQGANAGFSVPVFGRVRANFGGSRGQLVRNPASLTVLDQGTATYTTKRVIFTGQQQTRIFDLTKVLHYEVGTNGLWVTISTSNSKATSTLQTGNNHVLGPGSMFDVAHDALTEGEAGALEKVSALAELMRKTVAEAQAPKR
ncbi:MAG: hypothetical protein ORN27_09700 [Rhodoluna sp.]|nr:hypothetical protein [Rhodoluna sp.]